jgi:hypothetical protein
MVIGIGSAKTVNHPNAGKSGLLGTGEMILTLIGVATMAFN